MTALVASASLLSLPDDAPRIFALIAAVLVAWLAPRWLGSARAARSVVPASAFVAALLSALYLLVVLRGGPRIIDATSYWLQARALADGWLAFPVGEPEQAVLGRFLVRTDAPVALWDVARSWLGASGAAAAAPTGGVSGAAVIFPPGFPAVLAVGFLVGAPLAVGPALGAAIVVATAALGRSVERALAAAAPRRGGGEAAGLPETPRLAHVAALFSALSPAMRYHTADTMAHGLAALCFAVGLAALLIAGSATARSRRTPLLLLAGLAFGWLGATRPASALALGLCLLLASVGARVRAAAPLVSHAPRLAGAHPRAMKRGSEVLRFQRVGITLPAASTLGPVRSTANRPQGGERSAARRQRRVDRTQRLRGAAAPRERFCLAHRRRAFDAALGLAAFGLGATPGILLWLAHQQAATGSSWGSAQSLYYSLSDGPAGCFRYGFGPSIGCLGEHGTFVGHNLPDGYGLAAALGTTARRLQHHLPDALAFSPLFLLVPLGAWLGRSVGAVRLLGLGVLAQLVVYAPFYFDGNYPGGGARMLADVLPLEHVLAAVALRLLAARAPAARPSGRRLAGAVAACVLAGFALESGAGHAQLRERDGGAPMLQPALLAPLAARPDGRALVLVDTDHGLNLGLAPAGARGRGAPADRGRDGPTVRRYRGDGLDRLTWEALGRPATFRYHFEPGPGRLEPGQSPEPFTAWLAPLEFDALPTDELSLRIEAESLWPAREQRGAWAWPVDRAAAGASGDGWLRVLADRGGNVARPGAPGLVRLALPARWLGGRALLVRARLVGAARPGGPPAAAEIVVWADASLISRTEIVGAATPEAAPSWLELESTRLPAALSSLELSVHSAAEVDIDYIEVGPQRAAIAGPEGARRAEGP